MWQHKHNSGGVHKRKQDCGGRKLPLTKLVAQFLRKKDLNGTQKMSCSENLQ